MLATKSKQISKNGFFTCKNNFYVKMGSCRNDWQRVGRYKECQMILHEISIKSAIEQDLSGHCTGHLVNIHSWDRFKIVLVRNPERKLYYFLAKHKFWEYVLEFPSIFSIQLFKVLRVPALLGFWDFKKISLRKIRVSGTLRDPLLMWKSPTAHT